MSSTKLVEQPTLNNSHKIAYSKYWDKGFAVLPEILAKPQANGQFIKWAQYYKGAKPSPAMQAEWDSLIEHDIGMLTGEPSGLIGIDYDEALPEQIVKAAQLIGDTPIKKMGAKGYTAFYRYNGEPNITWSRDGVMYAELLSTGRKTTIPPSIHRKTGKPYIWNGAKELLDIDRADIPYLPNNFKELLDSLFSIIRTPPKYYPTEHHFESPTEAQVIEALNYCNPTASNEDWVAIGMALKSELGDAAFYEFDSWSAKGKSYDKNSIRSRWRSFNSHSITIGTLFKYAQDGGYRFPEQGRKTYKETDINSWHKKEMEAKAEIIQKGTALPDFYSQAPQHIKEIADWIVSTSMYPQPIITLGSVMAFLGFLMERDFTFNSLRANLYVANIAYSADGKEHINRCIRGLMIKADLDKHISYGWTSDTAIVEKLNNNNGKAFYLTDELQAALKSIANRSSNSREGAATEKLLQAYTGVEISTVDKADSKLNPTKVVKNPFITICGYTTPAIFEMCLGSTEVFSGFVGRLTVFKGNEFIPEENENFKGDAWEHVPHKITDIINRILSNRKRMQNPSDGSFNFMPKEISTEYLHIIKDYREKIRQKRNEMRMERNPMEAIFGRAAEMMLKYAMIASAGHTILEEHIHWAISIVEYNLGVICQVAESFADNKFERKKNQALQYIVKRGGIIEKSSFTKGCAIFDSARERNEIIAELKEMGRLREINIDGATKKKSGYEVIPDGL